MGIRRAVVFVTLSAVAACGTPRAPDAPEPTPSSDPVSTPAEPDSAITAPAPTAESADASLPNDAGTDAAADAGNPTSDVPPLELKGVKRCTAVELRDDACVEGLKAGMCLDGWCVGPATCPKYCAALEKRLLEGCRSLEPTAECKKFPDCVKATREGIVECKGAAAEAKTACMQGTCNAVRSLPPP